MNEHQPTPVTIWKFQIVRCAKRSFSKPTATSTRVAGYLTELPPREVLAQKLKSAVAIARERLAARTAGKAETVQKGEMHITGKDD